MFDGLNKVVNVPNKDKVTSKVIIMKATHVFPDLQHDNTRLQVWNKHFEEFVDVEDEDEIQPNSKVKLTRSMQTIPITIHQNVLDEVISMHQEDENANHQQQSTNSSTTQVKGLSGTCKPGWINSFKFPDLPDAISAKIKEGEPLTCGNEGAILDVIFEAVKLHSLYPKSHEYALLVELFLKKYPPTILNANHSKQLWTDKIQRKFQNARKRDPDIREMLVVKSRKRKAQNHEIPKNKLVKEKTTPPRYPPMWGMKNYLPQRPSSEDDNSVAKHNKWLQLEIFKKRPDFKEVSHLMEITLSDRRREIVKKGTSLQDIKDSFPWLFTEHELLAEFQRISGGTGVVELLEKGLTKYAQCIMGCLKKSKLNKGELDLAASGEDEDKGGLERAAVVLPTLLKEDIKDLWTFKDDENQNPNSIFIKTNERDILQSTSFKLVAEGMEICSTDSILNAMSCYMAAFYAFNLAYVPHLQKTISFVQNFLL